MSQFASLYRHGFARVAAAVPHLRPAEPEFNADRTLALANEAADEGAALVVFPELGLSAYAIDDLFHQQALADGVLGALGRIVDRSRELAPVLVVGAPLWAEAGVFNCAVIIHGGRILGAVPKSYLPEYREYYEKRQFRATRDLVGDSIELLDTKVPFGADLIFRSTDLPGFALFVEICEDVWTPIPPSTYGAMAGATILVNLSASNITVGKADYRRQLAAAQSARTISAYIYTAAGFGESTTDLAWDGQAMIYENGDLQVQAERFAVGEQIIYADLDLDRMVSDRATTSNFGDSVHDYRERLQSLRTVTFELGPAVLDQPVQLCRAVERFPYVPSDPGQRTERCEEVYNIQVRGLETRLRATALEKLVIGISGGLDSTHALIVCARVMDRLGLPRENVLAYTLPGFATGGETLANARELMAALGVSAHEIDIRPSATQMLHDLGHPAADGEPVYDVTYENVQAGERTSHLFRLANYQGGLVVGTGDLSELALGWSTYGVGDQMSHYNVNASVPKTLIQFILRWAIDTKQFDDRASRVLDAVLNTEISPELVPSDEESGELQGSEKIVGPYELQDFFLYYVLRLGYRPSKLAYLAEHTWGDRTRGRWPDLIPEERRHEYSLEEIRHWLGVFLERFFHISQFKRSALPNAPKVGSGGSLSPRGDWRAPSDGSAALWLGELERTVPEAERKRD